MRVVIEYELFLSVEWPEVITEGGTLEDCREMLQDALHEMIAAYRQQSKEISVGK